MTELQFDEETHTYTLDGRRIPSVTQVLDPISSMHMVDPQLLEERAAFGTAVHQAAELYLLGQLDTDDIDTDVWNCIFALKKFLMDTQIEPLFVEKRVYSPRHQYAGGVDLVAQKPLGEQVAIDFKTALVTPHTVGPQLAGYTQALEEEDIHIDERWCVQLNADGKYKLTPQPDLRDFVVFLSCLNIWQFNHGC